MASRTPLSKEQQAVLQAADRLAKAKVAKSWKGSQHPSLHDEIDKEMERAHSNLFRLVRRHVP